MSSEPKPASTENVTDVQDRPSTGDPVILRTEPPRSADRLADQLIKELNEGPKLANELKTAPEIVRDYADVAKLKSDADQIRTYDLELMRSNGALYHTGVKAVGCTLIIVVLSIAVIAIVQLVLMNTPINGTITIAIPDGLIALGSAAVGALAGLLTPLSGPGRR